MMRLVLSRFRRLNQKTRTPNSTCMVTYLQFAPVLTLHPYTKQGDAMSSSHAAEDPPHEEDGQQMQQAGERRCRVQSPCVQHLLMYMGRPGSSDLAFERIRRWRHDL